MKHITDYKRVTLRQFRRLSISIDKRQPREIADRPAIPGDSDLLLVIIESEHLARRVEQRQHYIQLTHPATDIRNLSGTRKHGIEISVIIF